MKRLIVGLCISASLLAAVSAFAFFYLFGGNEKRVVVTVPSFTGSMLADVVADGIFAIEHEGVYCDSPVGEIIGQTPSAGAKRKLAKGESCKITLKISLGKKLESIPRLVGFHYVEAANILREMGMNVRIVSIFDEEAERDTVLRSSPEAGSETARGERVTLFVAKNHIKGSVKVGDYIGLEKGEAVSKALSDGLCISEIILEHSDKYPSGTIIGQSIMKGASVPYGSEISLTVSSGEGKEQAKKRFWWERKR